ncbi:MAG: hypothetical protein JWQ30_841 [Sediminibacterium sp.]|nr:hypothetical protein [Sediminibacterium sp.]
MQKPVFGLLFLLLCAHADAQQRRSTGNSTSPTPVNYNSPTKGQLLVDKNNYADQNSATALKKTGTAPYAPSTSNPFSIFSIPTKNTKPDTMLAMPAGSIILIDARADNEKVGFMPLESDMQKKGYTTVGLQLDKKLSGWFKDNFIEKNISIDSNHPRHLEIMIRKFWFSNGVSELYSVANPKLRTTLYYQFDVYSSFNLGYYPQQKITGSFTTLYDKGNAYNELTDSLFAVLRKELHRQNLEVKEVDSNWQSPIDFNDYYNSKMRQVSHFEQMPRGLYATYQDFLEKNISGDSVELVKQYSNYDRAEMYACQLTAFKDRQHIPSNKSWGYYDGSFLFLNTGNGFFVKLIRSKENFNFYHLRNIQQDRIKQDILSGINIGNTSYRLLKDYTKAFALTYQLDTDTGILY